MAIARVVSCRVWHLVAFCAVVHVVGAQRPPSDSARRDSLPAVLIGHVVDSTGEGLSGAEITPEARARKALRSVRSFS